jgi:hypothetical protein
MAIRQNLLISANPEVQFVGEDLKPGVLQIRTVPVCTLMMRTKDSTENMIASLVNSFIRPLGGPETILKRFLKNTPRQKQRGMTSEKII